MPQTFAVPRPIHCRFVTLEGVGVSPNAGFAAYDVTSRLAEAAGGILYSTGLTPPDEPRGMPPGSLPRRAPGHVIVPRHDAGEARH